MAFKWVYFPPGEDSPFPYRKAHVREEDLDFFHELGAVDDQTYWEKEEKPVEVDLVEESTFKLFKDTADER